MDSRAWRDTVLRVAESQTCLKQQSTHARTCGTDVLLQLHRPSLSWRSCYKLFPRPSMPPGFVSSLPPGPLPHHISYPPISTPGLPPLCSMSALLMWFPQGSDCTLVVDVIRVIYLLKISSMKTEPVVHTSCTFCWGSHTASSMPRMFTKCLLNESWFLT